jgi:tetratricopeptide (TPR) repeat protein
VATLFLRPGLASITLILLIWCLASRPGSTAQSSSDGGSRPSVEELERLALAKLREKHKAIQNKMEFLVDSLTGGQQDADRARRELVNYGAYLLSDDRSVAEHLLDRFLKASSNVQRNRLAVVLQDLAGTLRRKKDTVVSLLLSEALKADHRFEAIASVLIAIKAPEINPRLEPLLEHENSRIRTAVIQLIGRTGKRVDGTRILPALASPDREVKLAAIQAIRDLGFNEGISRLTPLIASPDERIATAAVDALVHFKARGSVPDILDALKKTTEASRASRLITALGTIGPASKVSDQVRVEQALTGYLSSRRDTLVRAAGFALARLDKVNSEVERALTRGLKDEVARDPRNLVVRLELARVWKQLGECTRSRSHYNKAIKEYKNILRDHKRSPEFHTMTYVELAGCLARTGQFKIAARYLDKIPRRTVPLSRFLEHNPDFEAMRNDSQYQKYFKLD